jgi:hypothetical protein
LFAKGAMAGKAFPNTVFMGILFLRCAGATAVPSCFRELKTGA